jgi:hypothetical protein
LDIENDKIVAICVTRNPDKLRHVRVQMSPRLLVRTALTPDRKETSLMSSLHSPRVADVLDRLFTAAEQEDPPRFDRLQKELAERGEPLDEELRPYLEYVRYLVNNYVSQQIPLGDGLELSVKA